jgi:hypothetical protein
MGIFILGTAQFSNKYGVSKKKNAKPENNLSKISKICLRKRIHISDISFKYYNQFTCSKIKKLFKNNIYKISNLNLKNYKKKIDEINTTNENVYCIMFHDLRDIKKNYFYLILKYLIEQKKRKFFKIGASIYTKSDLQFCFKIFKKHLDVIQLPINILNRNFQEKKILIELKKRKIELHIRSIFLQGLLIMKKRPLYFKKWSHIFKEWDLLDQKKKIIICLNFIKNIRFKKKKIIIGCETASQLSSILKLFNKKINLKKFENFYSDDIKLIDPRKW